MLNKAVWLSLFLLAGYSGTAYCAAGDQYLLPKFGLMLIDLNNADPLLSLGLMYGIGLTENMSVEAEINAGISGGEYKEANNRGEYRVQTFASYLAYRHPLGKTGYLKGKLGVLTEQVELTRLELLSATKSSTSKDTGVASGLGAGVFMGRRLTMEVEVTVIDKDIRFYSLGTHYRF